MKMMIVTGHLARGIGFAMLVAAGVALSPLTPRADPSAPPSVAPPLTVPRPDMPEADTRREANRTRMLDARIERLHGGLQLTPAQEKLWPPVADAIRALAEARGRRFRDQLDAVADPIDKLRMQGDHMARVGAAMAGLAAATKPLVAGLTPDQKGKLPGLMERVPLRKVLPRAFGIPPQADAGTTGATSPPAPGASAPPIPRDRGPAQPNKDPDDDQ